LFLIEKKAPKKNPALKMVEKHRESISINSPNTTIIKSKSERNLAKERHSKSIRYQDEEEKNYQFIYQIDENLLNKNKKMNNKRKIEFLDEKMKKPYNEIIKWKLIENTGVEDHENTELLHFIKKLK